MSFDILAQVLSAAIALLATLVAGSDIFRPILRRILGKEEPTKSYSERMRELMQSLTESSREVDEILSEVSKVAFERQANLKSLEEDLARLEEREKEIQSRIEVLEQVPVAAVEHFASLQRISETRSARRDYLLFGAGVLVSTILSILIQIALP
jgi:DNA repair exonuclease SbcCD ATPase subunit